MFMFEFSWILQGNERVNKIYKRKLFIQVATDLFFRLHTLAMVIQLHTYLLNWVQSASFHVVARVISFFSEINVNCNCNIQQICQLSNTMEKRNKRIHIGRFHKCPQSHLLINPFLNFSENKYFCQFFS